MSGSKQVVQLHAHDSG